MTRQIQFCCSADGNRIAYSVAGKGPPLVRVASWMTHLNLDAQSPIWNHWFRELSQGHTLVRYDARGCGLSEREVGDLSVEAWQRDLEAVVNAAGLDRFHLLGFCQGGAVAASYAARHPDRVERLVLYDSFMYGGLARGATVDERREAEALAELIAVGWGKPMPAFRQLFTNLLIPGASPEQQRLFTELERQTASPATAAQLWRAFHQIDIRSTVPHIHSPSLVFHVRGDAMVPFEQGLMLASTIPNAQFVPLDGRNHILLESEPAWRRFLAETRDFLGTINPDMLTDGALPGYKDLTQREKDVLRLIARGLSNEEIAESLVISPKTVRNHVHRIYRKLKASSRAQAVVLAREAGIGKENS